MTNRRLFLDIHAIQTVPASNINRDDTGSPKTAQYGGVIRSRVSSQCWKRAIRKYFEKNSDKRNVGIRSLKIPEYIADKIVLKDSTIDYEKALELANTILNNGKIKTTIDKATKEPVMKALFFISNTQAEKLADIAVEGNVKDKNIIQKILIENPAIDIALFGRMVADDPSLNEDASCQVAHSISTHSVQTEFDFFTATDDLQKEDNAGAGMLGTVEYNSSTLYRYANIAIHEFNEQLKDKSSTINAIKLFVEAFVKSMPEGKINTFANQTLPSAILVTLREDRPVSLVTAYEKPIKSNDGYVDKSIKEMINEYEKVKKITKIPVYTELLTLNNENLKFENDTILNVNDISSLIDNLGDKLNELILEQQGE